jgi:hypothetical protein
MADGDNFVLGNANAATAETRLDRAGGAANKALTIVNQDGIGLSGD